MTVTTVDAMVIDATIVTTVDNRRRLLTIVDVDEKGPLAAVITKGDILVSVNGTLPQSRKRTSESIRGEFSLSKEQPLKKSESQFVSPASLDL